MDRRKDGKRDGRKDGRMLFFRILPVEAEGPKTLPQKPCTTFVLCGRHKRMTSRKFLQKNHKRKVKLNKNLKVSIQSSSSNQIKVSSKSFKIQLFHRQK